MRSAAARGPGAGWCKQRYRSARPRRAHQLDAHRPQSGGRPVFSGGFQMSHINESIDVDVPVKVAYDQWTQFESFPQFMEGVDRVEQVDDTTVDWTATIAGKTNK